MFLSFVQVGAGTSNNVAHTLSLPVAAATVSGMAWFGAMYGQDAGTKQLGLVTINSAATTATLAGIASTNANTASGSSVISGQIWYEF